MAQGGPSVAQLVEREALTLWLLDPWDRATRWVFFWFLFIFFFPAAALNFFNYVMQYVYRSIIIKQKPVLEEDSILL